MNKFDQIVANAREMFFTNKALDKMRPEAWLALREVVKSFPHDDEYSWNRWIFGEGSKFMKDLKTGDKSLISEVMVLWFHRKEK